jgi:hypothetical protein
MPAGLASHGDNAEDASYVAALSLPGYGFSDRTTEERSRSKTPHVSWADY